MKKVRAGISRITAGSVVCGPKLLCRLPTNKIKRSPQNEFHQHRVLKVNYGQISWCHTTSVLEIKHFFAVFCSPGANRFSARSDETFYLFTEQIEKPKSPFYLCKSVEQRTARVCIIKCRSIN